MKVLITGSSGLIGSEAVRFYAGEDHHVVGIDNDMRRYFFGEKGTTVPTRDNLISNYPNYQHLTIDIRDRQKVFEAIKTHKPDLIVHTAAQPSHDWAAKEPFTDFEVNAMGTLNLLEGTRLHKPDAVFIFLSTNKVYGDKPNTLPLQENETRFEYSDHHFRVGIGESFSVDNSMHSLFGASKLSADIIAQEYGKYFKMKVGIFRGGCLTGSHHAGVELHGFLSYLVHCATNSIPYTVIGYKGKQVRDQIHSSDVVQAIECFRKNPRFGEVYNIGGGYENSASVLEILNRLASLGYPVKNTYKDESRKGDHICYYSDLTKLKTHFPEFKIKMSLTNIIEEMLEAQTPLKKAA